MDTPKIVSQRTPQLTDEDLAKIPGCHSHCVRCHQVNCNHKVDNVTACSMTTCEACGWKFHQCKAEEHSWSCEEVRIPCINAVGGCPHYVKRCNMPTHLPVCPASVVNCRSSWYRWSRHAPEKGLCHSLPPNKIYVDCGQLDVALAMRDQRMLMDHLKPPSKLRRTLRNHLTQKYPAVPIAHRSESEESDDFSEADLLYAAYGKERSCASSGNVNVNPDKNESTASTEDDRDDSQERSVRSSVSAERVHDISRSVSVLHDIGGSQLHKILGIKLGDDNEDEICLHKVLGFNIFYDYSSKYVDKPVYDYTFFCAQNFRRDQYKWHYKNVHSDITADYANNMEQRCPLAYLGCTFSYPRLVPSQPNTEVYFSWLQESFGLRSLAQPYSPPETPNSDENSQTTTSCFQESAIQCNVDSKKSDQLLDCNATDSSGPSLSDLSNFDKQFDVPKVSQLSEQDRSLNSPKKPERSSLSPSRGDSSQGKEEMLSVQPVIYTALNPDSRVLFVYNVEQGSSNNKDLHCGLTDLPFEILQQIARRLDSFSLCNLSLTSRMLRDVCCSLLDNHGIVLLNWERQKIGDKVSWKVANKRWVFSSSFEPIKKWKLNDDHISMSDHLKDCRFNQDKVTHCGAQIPFPTTGRILKPISDI